MTSIVPPPAGGPMTWDEYEASPEDPHRECVDGVVVVTPGPDLDHQDISFELLSRLRGVLPPTLVVEVLSTNRPDALLLKMAKYAAAGLPDHWIVDPRERTLSVHVLDDSGVFRADRVLRDDEPAAPRGSGPASLALDLGTLLPPVTS